jgi:signal transduction histidine kinase/ActR/RegA family two-component response regulator
VPALLWSSDADGDDPDNAEIRLEQMAALAKLTPIIALVNIVNGSLTAGILASGSTPARVGPWLAAVWALALIRLVRWWRRRRLPLPTRVGREAPRRAIIIAGLSGLIWGASAFLLPEQSLDQMLFIMIVLAGMAAGAASTMAPIPGAALAFIVSSLGLLMVRLMLDGQAVHLALAGMILMYLLAMLALMKVVYDTFLNEPRSKVENRHLVEKLTEQTAAMTAAKELAEQANRAKSRFLAAASHDLRQPLNAMSLLVGLLRNRVAEPERPILGQIEVSLGAMIDLFNNLLDVSKFDAGAIKPEFRPVDTVVLLERLKIDFQGVAEAKGIGFRMVPCHVMLYSDAHLLERILRNLVANAVCHTDRGRVLIGCRRIGKIAVRIDVYDTGPGIASDQLGVIFEEFSQLRNPARQRGEGHGLGLAIASRAALLLGHDLSVTSAPGKGSRFSITVPRAETATSAGPAAGREPAAAPETIGRDAETIQQEDCHVLVVEDDPLVREAMQLALDAVGCRSHVAGSAAEALKRLREIPGAPRLIFAGYRLPGGVNGLETVRRLRGAVGAEVAACIVTGDLNDALKAEIEGDGAACLHKPVRAETLYRVVEKVCPRERSPLAPLGRALG